MDEHALKAYPGLQYLLYFHQKIASVTGAPGPSSGSHFIEPVPGMKLIEITTLCYGHGSDGSDGGDRRSRGKIPVWSMIILVFIANRILMPMIKRGDLILF